MLKKFILSNYKNFREDICIDFTKTAGYQFSTDCIADGIISKMLIYGRNATGKTNLGKALMDIRHTMFGARRLMADGAFLNADEKKDFALFCYCFQFGDKELTYEYARTSTGTLKTEKLKINEKVIFQCDFVAKKYKFDNLKYIDADTVNLRRYLQTLDSGETEETEEAEELKLPFLRWLINNTALEKDSALLKLAYYVREMKMVMQGNNMMLRPLRGYDTFFKILENREQLDDLESFLNAMGIECRLKLEKLPDGQKELYFEHEKLVPFYSNASSGTLALMDLYRRIVFTTGEMSMVYLDEFDAFYHYEMAENIVKFFKKNYPKCQVIMTSHNTNLMTNRLMRPDCLFILSREGTLTALCDATSRELREGHNLEKMYISGEFEKYE